MTDELEQALTRTITEATRHAPAPDDWFAARVRARYGRRRRRHLIGGAVAGVALVTATATAAAAFPMLVSDRRPDPVATTTASAAPTPSATAAAPPPEPVGPHQPKLVGPRTISGVRPVAEVWPDAVVRISRRGDGTTKVPRIMAFEAVDSERVVIAVESAFEQLGHFAVFDKRTGSTTRLPLPPAPPGVTAYRIGWNVGVGDGRFAWTMTGKRADGRYSDLDIWMLATPESSPVRLVSLPDGHRGGAVDRMAFGGGFLWWTVPELGAFRVPVSGGAVEAVPNSAGFLLENWPWVSNVSQETSGDPGYLTPDALPPPPGTPNPEVRNLVTGERRRVAVRKNTYIHACGPDWCSGRLSGVHRPILQRPDGSQYQILRDYIDTAYNHALGRFIALHGHHLPDLEIYDTRTGAMVRCGGQLGDAGMKVTIGVCPDPDNPNQQIVINLLAVR